MQRGAGCAQTEPQTRADVIRQERQEKEAELWPERQSPFVNRVNALVERGLREGLDSGQGADGPQFVLGGMRSGQGFSAGIGYRRRDLWRDRLSYRATARGTINRAYLVDFDLDFKSLRSERSFVNWYTKFESSPRMDYYGQGNSSNESDRTSYLYDDLTTDVHAAFQPARFLRLGLTGGFIGPHVGTGQARRRAFDRGDLRPDDGARLRGRSRVRPVGDLRRTSITATRGAALAAAACTACASDSTPISTSTATASARRSSRRSTTCRTSTRRA